MLFAANRDAATGKLSGSRAGAAADQPSHLLSGLVVCGQCGSSFHVGGTNGKGTVASLLAEVEEELFDSHNHTDADEVIENETADTANS